jgi:hypothetical protein
MTKTGDRGKFKDLPIGRRFVFAWEEESGPVSSLVRGPWIRTSQRKYCHSAHPTTLGGYRVGSINAEVILKEDA